MLIIKAYINEDQIGEIQIHNTGKHKDGIYRYEILEPPTPGAVIYHLRSKGWMALAARVLRTLLFPRLPGDRQTGGENA